ncbi:MAG: gamma-glutamyltransferase [Bdellovibrionota bacterium]
MKNFSFFIFLFLLSCSSLDTQSYVIPVKQSPEQKSLYTATGKHLVIATQGEAATEAARKIYKQGGNIIDAAVAASFVISVERPQSTGLGGGGFMMFKEAKSGKTYAIDFRERAPLKATARMYLDKKGDIIEGLSSEGHKSSAVPGIVAGLLETHKKFGKLSRAQVMAPAIELAEKGFKVYEHLENALNQTKDLLVKYPATAKIFLKADKTPYKVGDLLVQKDLAKTLRKISSSGASVFYNGSISRAIVNESLKNKGLISKKDLAIYKTKWREPVSGTYNGYTLLSMPPPSSGGTHVIEILNILEGASLAELGPSSSQGIHLRAAAMQQAFADRATYMGDPDFFKEIPLKGLLSKKYAADVRSRIEKEGHQVSTAVRAGKASAYESEETTNFSMMDIEGNVVVSTQTINGYMGSGVVVPGTGILMNNEMDDFSAKPGASNIFGAIGGIPNSIEPRKTPLSSMAPTIVLKDGTPVMALGAPGGTRIITCVAQTILNYLEYKMPLYDAVAALRMHHQWQPDQIDIEEPGPGKSVVKKLEQMGYKVNLGRIGCRVNAVAREEGSLLGAADPRDLGSSYAE